MVLSIKQLNKWLKKGYSSVFSLLWWILSKLFKQNSTVGIKIKNRIEAYSKPSIICFQMFDHFPQNKEWLNQFKRKLQQGIVFFLLIVNSPFGCQSSQSPKTIPKQDGRHSFEKFRATIKSFPYKAPRSRTEKVINNYVKLEVGMSKTQVANLIGEPDYCQLSYGPKRLNMECRGSEWVYYFSMNEDSANNFDSVVYIFFDLNDKMITASPVNIEGLSPIYTPTK